MASPCPVTHAPLALRHRACCGHVPRLLGGAAFALLLHARVTAQALRLNGPLAPGGDVAEFQVAPDGSRVFYRADQDVDEVFELFSVSIDGGSPLELNGPLAAGGSVGREFVHNLRVSPGGNRVLYWADQDEDEAFELFSVPSDGSQPPVQLNGPLVPGGDVQFTPTFLPAQAFAPMTPDGSRVLYVADQEQNEVFELYCAPLDGSQPAVKLSAVLVPGGDVVLSTPPFGPNPIWPQVSPDGSSAVYRADQEADDVFELYGVPLDGSRLPLKLNQPLGPDGDVLSALISPDGAWVLYVARLDASGPIELYRVALRGRRPERRRISGQNRVRLNVDLDPGEAVSRVSISPDGSRVLYQANPSGGASDELFSVPINGSSPSVKLSKPGDGAVFTSVTSSVDARVVYQAGNEEAFDWKLFCAPIDGSSERIQISTLSALGYVRGDFELVPQANRVVYAFALTGSGAGSELHSVPIDGSASPVKLNPAGTSAVSFRVGAGGRHVLYLQSPLPSGPLELFAAPVDGSRPAWRLNAPLVASRNVVGFAVTAAKRVLYLADQEVDEVFELFETFLERPFLRAR
ncbi:MAG: hypothetical protein HOP15_09995 [Planctomycetes bacterium]|nr:hypothetical protein [Planctomycetota bacterium]